MSHAYPPLDLAIRTPLVELCGATDELLEALVPVIRAGVYDTRAPLPFDDPMSFYEDSPVREWRWLQAIWAGRSRVDADEWWRLYFVVRIDGVPVGMQDLIGVSFRSTRAVATFSWLARQYQGRGLGREMRAAVLHLAFDGLGSERAESVAFHDNHASNRVSQSLGYEPNGTSWATRKGVAAPMNRYVLTRERWSSHRRDDIVVSGLEPCLAVLGL